jgi:hypothetical protein
MPDPKARATVYFDAPTWQAFRIACLERKTSASQQLNVLMAAQLDRWKEETTQQDSSDNASGPRQ